MPSQRIAASYPRTSQEKDDAFSITSQVHANRQYAAQRGISLPAEYEFAEDFTGKVLDRPELNKIRQLIRQKAINTFIVYATDRLARKVGVADLLLDELFDNGIELHIVAWGTGVRDTPEDRMRFSMESTFSDFERRKIIERTMRGRRSKAEAGIYIGTGRPPYGYTKVGKKREMRLVINQEQARIINQIFIWYVKERVGVLEILRRLRGTPSPGDDQGSKIKQIGVGEWRDTTVYKILRDEAYIGKYWLYRKTDHPTSVNVPPIIDETLWQLAQKRLNEGKKLSKRNTRYDYLMGKRMKCSCGYSAGARSHITDGKLYQYYSCTTMTETTVRGKCGLPQIRAERVDAEVWKWVCEMMRYPEALRENLLASQKILAEHNAELQERMKRIDARITKEKRKLAILLAEYAEVAADEGNDLPEYAVAKEATEHIKQIYRQSKEDAERLFAELTTEREKLAVQLEQVTISDELIDDLTRFAYELKDRLDELDFASRRGLVERLAVWGELSIEHGEQVLTIHWHTHTFRRLLANPTSS